MVCAVIKEVQVIVKTTYNLKDGSVLANDQIQVLGG